MKKNERTPVALLKKTGRALHRRSFQMKRSTMQASVAAAAAAAVAALLLLSTILRRQTTGMTRRHHRGKTERRSPGANRRSHSRRKQVSAKSDMTEGAAALPVGEKVEVVLGTKRTSGAPGTTAAAAALATARAVGGDEPSDEVGQGIERTGADGAGAAAAVTPEAEVEATVDEEVAQGVQSAQAGVKIEAEAEVGGGDAALKAQVRVRGPVAKTETDETRRPLQVQTVDAHRFQWNIVTHTLKGSSL